MYNTSQVSTNDCQFSFSTASSMTSSSASEAARIQQEIALLTGTTNIYPTTEILTLFSRSYQSSQIRINHSPIDRISHSPKEQHIRQSKLQAPINSVQATSKIRPSSSTDFQTFSASSPTHSNPIRNSRHRHWRGCIRIIGSFSRPQRSCVLFLQVACLSNQGTTCVLSISMRYFQCRKLFPQKSLLPGRHIHIPNSLGLKQATLFPMAAHISQSRLAGEVEAVGVVVEVLLT